VTYAGGGGGGGGNAGGSGGTGGGGNGTTTTGSSGTANTGGGAGGGSQNNSGGTGGSGIVILRYLTGVGSATGGTITSTGGYTIHTFTADGTFAFTAPTIVVDQGSFLLTGQDVIGRFGRLIALAHGTFALSGYSLSFLGSLWTRLTKSASSFLNGTKASTNWSNTSKSSTSFTNDTKSS
jgi:hypothetical protein